MSSRLNELGVKLKEKGVLKVRFCFDQKAKSESPSFVKDEVVLLLQNYLDGRVRKLDGFPNEVLPKN